MTTSQKILKYIAIAFAILLIIIIISAISKGIFLTSMIFDKKDSQKPLENPKTYQLSQSITELDIELSDINLNIKSGDSFYVETNAKDISVKEKQNKLTIKDENSISALKSNLVVTIYIPDNLVMSKADIQTGAGKIYIQALTADQIDFDLGAGEVTIDKIISNFKTEIEGGAGKITINDGMLCNVDCDMGVGEVNISSAFIGSSTFNQGIGKANLNISEDKSLYTLNINKGIGKATVDGNEVANGTVIGDGAKIITINGGVGEIEVDFK